MALSIFQRTVTDNRGNIIPGASVAVRDMDGGDLVPIFEDRAGVTQMPNPFVTDSEGMARFYTEPGEYQVTATSDLGSVTWVHVAIDGTVRADLADPAQGAEMVAYSAAQSVGVKLSEIASRADEGDTQKTLIRFKAGGSTSDTVVVNASVNDAAANVICGVIAGGGALSDEQYIGYGKNREVFSAAGTDFSWLHLPTGGDLSNLRLFRLSSFRVMTILSSPTHYSAEISGSQVDITLVAPLAAGERLIVEDRAAKVIYSGVRPDYSWIGGGYDNIIEGGVMQHVTGAHHRVIGGDHGTLIGGSYGVINGGSYGAIIGGTNNEIGTGAGVASIVAGGYRNLASGATSAIIGGQENTASGAQTAIVGGYRNTASGTASFVAGRNNTASGSDSFIAGDGNTSSGFYSSAFGKGHVITHLHSHIKAGLNGVTSWQGQVIDWAHRDTGAAQTNLRQRFSLDLSRYTTNNAASLLELLNGVSAIAQPNVSVWKCRLEVICRAANGAGGSWNLTFSTVRDTTTTTFLAAAVKEAIVPSGLGTAGNAADVSVSLNGAGAIEITVQPRKDVSIQTKWAAVLTVLEVN